MCRKLQTIMLGSFFLCAPFTGSTQEIGPDGAGGAADPGAEVFEQSCVSCHSSAESGRAPGRFMLSTLTPQAIVAALEDGVMRVESESLSSEDRIAVAEHLTGRSYAQELLPESAWCETRGFAGLDTSRISYMGFGGNFRGTGMQDSASAGLTAEKVPDLELQWAFAMPGAVQVRTKPTVVEDMIIVGDMYGAVYAIEAASGCVRWLFRADSGARSAIVLGESPDGAPMAWFVDYRANVYALDVTTGKLVWRVKAGRHAEASNTGSPTLHDGKLIVPVSNMEVVAAMDPTYQCCTSSGAVNAIDAYTGETIWYHRVIAEAPAPTGKNELGVQQFGPSGATVWSSPTIDVRRDLVYVGTGENLSHPTTNTSDAILAIDIDTGELAWSFQGTKADAFTMACTTADNRQNCPSPTGPDLDFGMAPILIERSDGKEILVVGQKSGVVWALDPDDDGEVLWSTRIGKGSALGGIHWGMATDGRRVYAPVADRQGAVIVDVDPDRTASPGLYALDLMNGNVDWSVPAPEDTCLGKQGCYPAYSAAPSMIPGVVFSGGLDGYIRAFSTDDGSVIWQFDTTGEYETVNGVPGRGGSIDGPGPVIANGMLFVNSGYGAFNQMAGNVLLAFATED